jgi:hypothetical protein
MATLRVFKKPSRFELPTEYKKINNDGENNISFVKKINSEVEGFNKYLIGRYFQKTIFISKPTETGIEESETTKPVSIICQVYISSNNSEDKIFVVGSDADSLNPELLKFSNTDLLKSENIDMEALEKKSFTSGAVKLMGHKYNQSNDTVNYTVRKIDGSPFRSQDPDFVSCDVTEKEVLEVMLNLEGNPIFHVYADGKITRRGREESNGADFELLKTVYQLIKQLTS